MKRFLIILLILLTFAGCEIREEYTFKEDGSGTYEMAFDLSEFMNMGEASDSTAVKQEVDTIINFASFLDDKKDSISQLDLTEQEKLEALRPLQIVMKISDSAQQMNMRLRYTFKTMEDLSNFSSAVEQANIKELKELSASSEGTEADSTQQQDIFAMAESFDTYFSVDKFSRKITEEARLRTVLQKDTALTADDPFADIVRFKQVFRFPYRVKAVDNENARILSDFRGVELEANMYDLNNNPDFFNIEVLFEK